MLRKFYLKNFFLIYKNHVKYNSLNFKISFKENYMLISIVADIKFLEKKQMIVVQ